MKSNRRRVWIAGAIVAAGSLFSACTGNAETRKDAEALPSAEEQPPQKTDSLEAKRDEPLRIVMVGDIMMGTTFPKGGSFLPKNDGANLYDDTKEILSSADIAAGNLEGSMYDGDGTPKPMKNPENYYAFKMPERYIKHLEEAGFDFLGLANNHINDFGPKALDGTMKVLDSSPIAYAGVRDKKPTAIIEKDGRKIGFVAFGFNSGMPSIINTEEIKRLVGGLREECDIVVVSFHGGGEGKRYQHVPHGRETFLGGDRGDVEKFAHAAVDAGADVVYGHSPHVPRALELYKDRIIFYSLGNFCTPYKFNLTGENGLAPIAEVTVNPDGTFAEGQIHSFVQNKGEGPRKDPTHRAAKKMRELTLADFPATPLAISDTGVITRK